jgi:hypothetical protein
MKYDRANLEDTLRVAKILALKSNKPKYVFATGDGYKIDHQIPPFSIKYYSVKPVCWTCMQLLFNR